MFLLSELIGMASLFLAELCAVRCALRFLLSRVQCLHLQGKLIIFIDNLAAVRITNAQWFPTANIDLCLEIHNMLSTIRKKSQTVLIHWLPAHEGVFGNESVDQLAKQAANLVKSPSPIPGQPPIPYKLARGILRTSIWNYQQEQWLKTLEEHLPLEQDHLSRIHSSVRSSKLFDVGDRATQTTLARLRFGHVDLQAHLSRWDSSVSPLYVCGQEEETVGHYLLRCKEHAGPRQAMFHKVRQILPEDVTITEGLLLGGNEFKWGTELYHAVAKAIMLYIRRTGRF